MFYIVLRKNLQPRTAWPGDLLKAHLAWADREYQARNLILSGPADGKSGGIYLIKADDLHTAKSVAERDPIIGGGFCTYDIIDWDIQRGVGLLTT